MVRVFANGLEDLGSIPGQVIPKTPPAFWLGRLAFVLDGVSKPMADLRPKGR